jgi:biotin carboxyl carrier protein
MSGRETAAREVKLRAVVDGETLDVRVAASGEVSVAASESGETTDLHVATGGGAPPLSVIVEPAASEATRARVATVDGLTWVFIDGDVFLVQVADAQQAPTRRRDRSDQDALAAPMPATVSRILVDIGQPVARGDTLVLLEAMKMEMPIKAPHAGHVTAIHCQPGELVQPGMPLLDLEAAS